MYFIAGGEGAAPWLYVRSRLAEAWHCRPSDIDPDEDADEIGLQLAMWALEQRWRPRE